MQADASSSIDLSLAVNYLPACSCAVKSFLLSLALCGAHSLRAAPAYVGVGALLVFDRLVQGRACILDGSSVLMGIFAAHVVCEVQESQSAHPYPAWMHWAFLALSAEWVGLSGCRLYLCSGGQIRTAVPASSRRAAQQWEFLASCGHVVLCAFYRAPQPEPRGVRISRHMGFVCLCVCWMYVIGIYLRRVTHVAADSAVHFASFFWPVLYVHPYVAAAYACAVLAGVALHLRPAPAAPAQQGPGRHLPPPLRLEIMPACEEVVSAPAHKSPAAAQDAGPDAESLEELERIFKQALLSRDHHPPA